MEQTIRAIIEDLNPTFQADGGDLRIREIAQDGVKIDLVIGPTACRECLMSPDVIGETVARLVQARLGRGIKVTVTEVC